MIVGAVLACARARASGSSRPSVRPFAFHPVHSTAAATSTAARTQGATKPKSNVRFHPVVAVLGAPSLFQSGPQTDDTERINLSPAIELQDEVCFNAMQDKKHDTLEATCRTVCTRLQVRCHGGRENSCAQLAVVLPVHRRAAPSTPAPPRQRLKRELAPPRWLRVGARGAPCRCRA